MKGLIIFIQNFLNFAFFLIPLTTFLYLLEVLTLISFLLKLKIDQHSYLLPSLEIDHYYF